MRDEDKISIISYASDVKVELNGVSATKVDSIKTKVANLSASGQSNLNVKNSIQLSLETVKENYIEGGNNRIILTTDGDISNDRREDLKDFIKNNLPPNTYFSILLFNDATLYQKQLGDLANYINADLLVITERNMQELLLKEL
jgi:Ca-activated chloride channel family protein